MDTWSRGVRQLIVSLAAVAAVTILYVRWLHVSNAATVSTTFLLIVLIVATWAPFWVAALTSVVAMLCFNFFFLPPVGTWTIADPQNWIALFAFLIVSLIASNLSAAARAQTSKAMARRDELARLFDLSRDVLLMTDSHEAMEMLARAIARRFDIAAVTIALPRGHEWDLSHAGGRPRDLNPRRLSEAFAAAEATLEFDAHLRTYAGHTTLAADGETVRLVPLRSGTRPIGLLATVGREIEPGMLDALGGIVAMAIERVWLLEERKSAALTRQSEQLKSALLASLAHDLRTPLTAIRVAASNTKASWLTPEARLEQSDVILKEVERLTRLFDNILDMARIDAGGVARERRWTHASEIIAAALDQLDQSLARSRVHVQIDSELTVEVDPRLTAASLAHVLENAAAYSPAESPIDVHASVTDEGLKLEVRDHGPGIEPADLPRIFERFYRGSGSKTQVSGIGMGLSIARGLLAVQQGRIWVENCHDGGARFTIVVPAPTRAVAANPLSPA
jgi:two-component system sensor histidine kinase KdpD